MLSHDEHQAMIMFDKLLMAAKDNETIADLLDQTLNVARMIDPRADEKIQYGPLQRMHFEWQQMKHRMDNLDKKMDQYINQQNRYPGPYTGATGYPLTATSTGSSSSMWPSNPGWGISPITASDIATMSYNQPSLTDDQNLKDMTERLRKIVKNIADPKDYDVDPTTDAK
jgi:hypothetical protein